MKKPPQLAFWVWPLVIAAQITLCSAQSLPDGWWLQNSPEKVWAQAQATNEGVAFLYGEKFGSTLSQNPNPFAKTNDNARVEFFQRRNADGFVETKGSNWMGNSNGRITNSKVVITFSHMDS
jgi:hypothetical protein